MKQIPRILIVGAILVLFDPRVQAGEPGLYFPPAQGKWETLKPSEVGWDRNKLQKALDYAGKNQSSGVVILHRGRIFAECYRDVRGARSARYRARIPGRDKAGHAIADVKRDLYHRGHCATEGFAQDRGPNRSMKAWRAT